MKKKSLRRSRPLSFTPESRGIAADHQDGYEDLYFLAQSCHKAAKKLTGSLQLGLNPLGDFDAYPVLIMYRHAVELFMKAMILGEGGNFLERKPDEISVSKSRSVSWLAQFVMQIVTALGCEEEFRCAGVQNLADFKRLVGEVNEIDAMNLTFVPGRNPMTHLPDLFRRLDALLDLLDSTADALAAEWDLRNGICGMMR